MKSRVRYKVMDQSSFADMLVYAKLPPHPFWSNVEQKIDFSFADSLCSVLYSGQGQRPYAPSLKLKIHLIQLYYDLSDRQVEEKIIGDLFIKRFLGLSVDFFGFDHSTIGLDRSRMGQPMFQACHLYVLAQLHNYGLWGDQGEHWIIDSFPTEVGLPRVSAYRLIQKAMVHLVQQLKRQHKDLYSRAQKECDLDAMTHRPVKGAPPSEWLLAFSKLVAQAYALLQWLAHKDVKDAIAASDPREQDEHRLAHHQNLLQQILTENARLVESPSQEDAGEPPTGTPLAGSSAETMSMDTAEATPAPAAPVNATPDDDVPVASEEDAIRYTKIPIKQRDANRIVSVTHPDARMGKKNKFTVIQGFKTQNLISTTGIILGTRVIPATEHDRDAMVEMVKEVRAFMGLSPKAVIGDTAYGLGKQRTAMKQEGIDLVAPLPKSSNPTGLYDHAQFRYDTEQDRFICPAEQHTKRKRANPQLEGTQYYFAKKTCAACPLREACTTNKDGRSVFRSDYVELYEAAALYNESEEGKAVYRKRSRVEQKNHELKNHCGLDKTESRSIETIEIKAKMAAIAVNLKHMIRVLIHPRPGFIRRPQMS